MHIFLSDDFGKPARADASTNFKDFSGELESADGNGLASNSLPIDKDALIGDDIDDGSKLAFKGAIVDPGDSSNLYKSVVSLSYDVLTIPWL